MATNVVVMALSLYIWLQIVLLLLDCRSTSLKDCLTSARFGLQPTPIRNLLRKSVEQKFQLSRRYARQPKSTRAPYVIFEAAPIAPQSMF